MMPPLPTCPICYEFLQDQEDEFNPNSHAVVLLCGHSFHYNCIDTFHSHQHEAYLTDYEPPYDNYAIYFCPTCRAESCLRPATLDGETFPYYVKLYLETSDLATSDSTLTARISILEHLTPEAKTVYRLVERAREVQAGLKDGLKYLPRNRMERAFLSEKALSEESVKGIEVWKEVAEKMMKRVAETRMNVVVQDELRGISRSLSALTSNLDLIRQLQNLSQTEVSLRARQAELESDLTSSRQEQWAREKEIRLEYVENQLEVRDKLMEDQKAAWGRRQERWKIEAEELEKEASLRRAEKFEAQENLRALRFEFNNFQTDYDALKVRASLDRAKAEKAVKEMTEMKVHLAKERAIIRDQRSEIVALKKKVIVLTKKASGTPTPRRSPAHRNFNDMRFKASLLDPSSPWIKRRGSVCGFDGLPGAGWGSPAQVRASPRAGNHRRAWSDATGIKRATGFERLAETVAEEFDDGDDEGLMDLRMVELNDQNLAISRFLNATSAKRSYGGHVDVERLLVNFEASKSTSSPNGDERNKSSFLIPDSISDFSFGSFTLGSEILRGDKAFTCWQRPHLDSPRGQFDSPLRRSRKRVNLADVARQRRSTSSGISEHESGGKVWFNSEDKGVGFWPDSPEIHSPKPAKFLRTSLSERSMASAKGLRD